MRIENDIKLDFDDVLIRPKRSTLVSRQDVDLKRTFTFLHNGVSWTGIPIVASNMDTIGTFEVYRILSDYGIMTVLHKFYSDKEVSEGINDEYSDDLYNYLVFSAGSSSKERSYLLQRYINLCTTKFICIDVANGYSQYFVDSVKEYREVFPEATIIAGNVVTGEMTEELLLAGADIIKIGIGSGSVCTTRIKTGVGSPQLSSVVECSDAAHGLGGHIMSDGGCRTPGDIAKAFGAGADFVMIGGMLAGHNETSTIFHGMSSEEAQVQHYGERKSYRAAEGKEVVVPSKGPLSSTIEDILGGLRSTCTYVGASKLKELSKRTTFIRVHNTHNKVFE